MFKNFAASGSNANHSHKKTEESKMPSGILLPPNQSASAVEGKNCAISETKLETSGKLDEKAPNVEIDQSTTAKSAVKNEKPTGNESSYLII